MDRLRDRIEGVDGAEVAVAISAVVDQHTARIEEAEARIDVLELGRDLSDEQLMWVALDERMGRLETEQAATRSAAESALRALRQALRAIG